MFLIIGNFCCIAIERPSLQKELVNLHQKSFMRSTPVFQMIATTFQRTDQDILKQNGEENLQH